MDCMGHVNFIYQPLLFETSWSLLSPLLTFPETNIAPENGWLEYDRFLLGRPIFRCYVSFREGTSSPISHFCEIQGIIAATRPSWSLRTALCRNLPKATVPWTPKPSVQWPSQGAPGCLRALLYIGDDEKKISDIFWDYSEWWFQIFFIFTSIWGKCQFWLIFLRWVETTNQYFINHEIRIPNRKQPGWLMESKALEGCFSRDSESERVWESCERGRLVACLSVWNTARLYQRYQWQKLTTYSTKSIKKWFIVHYTAVFSCRQNKPCQMSFIKEHREHIQLSLSLYIFSVPFLHEKTSVVYIVVSILPPFETPFVCDFHPVKTHTSTSLPPWKNCVSPGSLIFLGEGKNLFSKRQGGNLPKLCHFIDSRAEAPPSISGNFHGFLTKTVELWCGIWKLRGFSRENDGESQGLVAHPPNVIRWLTIIVPW